MYTLCYTLVVGTLENQSYIKVVKKDLPTQSRQIFVATVITGLGGNSIVYTFCMRSL
jgi:hypothetical protein